MAPVTSSPCAAAGAASASVREWAGAYRQLGWPVTQRDGQVLLDLDSAGAVALVIAAPLVTAVVERLAGRRCLPAVLAHSALRGYRVILAGERDEVPLSWPRWVHRLTGTVGLPPTQTAHGRLSWVHAPQPDALRLCREFDVCAALMAVLADLAPGTRHDQRWSRSGSAVAAALTSGLTDAPQN